MFAPKYIAQLPAIRALGIAYRCAIHRELYELIGAQRG